MAFYRCFFPHISGEQAEKLLQESGVEGTFLIRNSTERGYYTLTAKCAIGIIHTRIHFNGDGYEFRFINYF